MARDPCLFFPVQRPGCAWLYVLELRDGGIKIGRTRVPRRRARQHGFGREGGRAVRFHLSAPFAESLDTYTERLALSFASAIGLRIRHTEEFRGLDFVDGLACMRAAINIVGRQDDVARPRSVRLAMSRQAGA